MTPNVIQGITDSAFVSTLDLDMPQKEMNAIFNGLGDQGKAYMFIRSLGFETPVANDLYYHFEIDYYHENFKIKDAVGDPGAGNSIDIVLDADSLDDDYNYYPQKNDEVMFKNEVVGWITDIVETDGGATVTLTVMPNQESDNIDSKAQDEKVIIIGGTWTEGSGMPGDISVKVDQYSNEAGIVKAAIGSTGTQLVNETWIRAYNKAGEYQGMWSEAMKAMDYRMLTKLDGMFWFSKRITNTLTPARSLDATSGYYHKATEGLIPAIRRLGNVNTYTAGSFAITKFDEYERTLIQEHVPVDTPIWTPLGLEIYQELTTTLKTYFADTNIIFVEKVINDKLFHKNQSLGASVNFKYLQRSYNFMFSLLGGFSNKKTFGTTGFDMAKMGVMIPIDTNKDPKTKNDIPSIGTRYRKMGAYDRRFITAKLSGIGATYAGEQPLNTIDTAHTYQMAHLGNEFYGVNRMILIDNS